MIIIDLVRRLAIKRLRRVGLIVEQQIALQPLIGSADGVIRVQIDLLIFQAPPESFHAYVIPPAAVAVHADLNAVVFQESREPLAGELAPVIRVEDLRAAILRDRLSHGVQTEVCGQRIGEPPGQHPATGSVQAGEEIHEAASHWNIGDIGRPDVIGRTDREIAEEILIDGVGRMPPTQMRFPIQRLNPHPAHEGGHLASPNGMALVP